MSLGFLHNHFFFFLRLFLGGLERGLPFRAQGMLTGTGLFLISKDSVKVVTCLKEELVKDADEVFKLQHIDVSYAVLHITQGICIPV